MRQIIFVALILENTIRDNGNAEFVAQVKDELVCVNRVANIEGKFKLAHLRIILIIVQYLQPALRHKITYRRISAAVPESLLPPKSATTLGGYVRTISVPVSEFGLGKRNGGRLRRYLDELKSCQISVVSSRGKVEMKPLITGFDYPQFARILDIHISDSVLMSLLTTEEGYFTFSRTMALSITNRYTLRIYWLICSWKQKGGFAITMDKFRRQFSLGNAYIRQDNLTSKIIQPAHEELKERFPVFFEYRLYTTASKYIVFKVKSVKSDAEIQTDLFTARDTVFELLASVGASVTLLSDIFVQLDHEDLLPFIHKLAEVITYIRTNRTGRSIQDVDAYILTAITSWHTNWLSRYTVAE